jgi:hypothetical protein
MKRDLSKPLASTFGDEPKGKKISKAKFESPSGRVKGEQRLAVSKAGDKNKQRQAEAAAAPKPMSKGKKAAIAIGTGVAAAGKVAYDLYHDGLRKDYGTHRASLTFKEQESVKTHPSNRELRKWKKSR